MKKNALLISNLVKYDELTHLIRIMKTTVFLIFVVAFQMIATEAGAQKTKINISKNELSLRELITEIEKQTDYLFVYKDSEINVSEQVKVDARNKPVADVLKQVFANGPVTYEYANNYISLRMMSEKEQLAASRQQQKKQLSGTVVDEYGEPIIGANVVEKGTTNGMITDIDGKFVLSVAESAVLQVSYIGYVAQEIMVKNQQTIRFTLQEDSKILEEVVVIGYGTMKKSDLTGSVSQVKSKDINMYPSANVIQALTGKAPGVQVMQNTGAPGASVSIRVRGANSIMGSNEPLYVVDGFPVSSIAAVNNSDIESVEVLKDASATAIYGSRGANGVVMITTKAGRTGKTQIDFEWSLSNQTLSKKLDMMNAAEYAEFYNMQRRNDKLGEYFSEDDIKKIGKGFDWQDALFTNALMLNTSVGITGGTDKTKFSTSLSLYDQQGIIKGSAYKRYSLRSNIKHNLNERLSVEMSLIASKIDQKNKNSSQGNRGGSLIGAILSAPPTLTPYNDDGSYRVLLTAYPFLSSNLRNPVNLVNEAKSVNSENRILSNVAILYKPIPELTFKILGGIENTDSRSDSYSTTKLYGSSGNAYIGTGQFVSLLNENTVTFSKTWNAVHHFSALAGFTYQDFTSKSTGAGGSGFISDVIETYDLLSASNAGIPTSSYSKSVLLSYLSRVNYNYNDRYLLTVSFRADGSSKFSEGNKWGYFPSGALAWRISNEEFLKNNPTMSNLKLRLSWGVTGSQAIGAYATMEQLVASKTVFSNELYNAYAPSVRKPGNLKWETTDQKGIGLDLGLFNNRLEFIVDYYKKNTRDLLNTVPLPPTYGYTSTIQNVGEVSNRGFEFGINGRPFTGDFSWEIYANVSFNRNKVEKLYGGDDILGGYFDITAITDYSNILREGQSIGQFWGYLEDGYTDSGAIKYKDLDEDSAITVNDKTYIGNPNPDFIYGLNSVMNYRNFELSFFLQGSQGNDIFNISSIGNTVDYAYGLNMPREVYLDNWSPTNVNAKYPLVSKNTAVKVSDRFIQDGSYLRLKNIQLAYTLLANQIKVNWFQSVQFYVSGQNLLTFTNYNWWDPEINSLGGANSVNQGYDYYTYPTSKSVTFGLRMKF